MKKIIQSFYEIKLLKIIPSLLKIYVKYINLKTIIKHNHSSIQLNLKIQ